MNIYFHIDKLFSENQHIVQRANNIIIFCDAMEQGIYRSKLDKYSSIRIIYDGTSITDTINLSCFIDHDISQNSYIANIINYIVKKLNQHDVYISIQNRYLRNMIFDVEICSSQLSKILSLKFKKMS